MHEVFGLPNGKEMPCWMRSSVFSTDPASNDASSSGTRTTDEERALNRDHELGGNGKTEVSELNQ